MSRDTLRKVYFLRPIGLPGPIKIGCSYWPENRLHHFSRWSPLPLELVGYFSGDHSLEGRIHRYLIADHLHHEWFAPSATVLSTMQGLLDGSFCLRTLPKRGISYRVIGKSAAYAAASEAA